VKTPSEVAISPEVEARLALAWSGLPSEIRSAPATEAQLDLLEADLGVHVPAGVRWFLLHLGGGVVGSDWIDDVTQLRASHAKFGRERSAWGLPECFVIGWDGSGNPIAVENGTGRLIVPDHDFGGVHELAPSFEEFLVRCLLGPG
jgi:hypothetical protein